MARILITGGAGYVGSHCAKALCSAGHECVIFDDLSSGRRDFVRWGPLVEADIRDSTALDHIFSVQQIDAVLHFAALSSVAESMAHPGRYHDINVHGTQVLLDAMVRARVGVLVFSSSCAIYGEPEHVPITEASTCHPVNPYGVSKLTCERMMDDFGKVHGIKSVRLRYFNAAGADAGSELGEDHDSESRLIPLALDALTGRRPALSLYGSDYSTPDGTAIRDYIHVSDLADAHLRGLQRLLDGGDTIALNLGTGTGASVRQVLDTIWHVTGRVVPVQRAPRRPGDPAMLVADAKKAKEFFGWSPERSDLKTIVSDAWRWHRKRFQRADALGSGQ
ncbi:MAG: UDP-glucose 4-epimerase GalE [Rhizomicrobium sp.]|jgi:UDP-glucose-4-epimerase GalE